MQWMAAAWRRLSGREGRRLWSRQSQSLASRLVRQVARRSAGAPAGVPCVGVRSTQRAVVAIGQRLAFSLALGALLHVWCRWFLDGLLLAWAPDLCPQWRRKTFGASHSTLLVRCPLCPTFRCPHCSLRHDLWRQRRRWLRWLKEVVPLPGRRFLRGCCLHHAHGGYWWESGSLGCEIWGKGDAHRFGSVTCYGYGYIHGPT